MRKGITKRLGFSILFIVLFAQQIGISTYDYFAVLEYQSLLSQEVAIGQWLREKTSPNALVAGWDIGALGYFSERKVLDIVGLVTPEIIPFKKEKKVWEYIVKEHPTYLVDITPSDYHFVSMEQDVAEFEKVQSKSYSMFRLSKTAITEKHTITLYKINWK